MSRRESETLRLFRDQMRGWCDYYRSTVGNSPFDSAGAARELASLLEKWVFGAESFATRIVSSTERSIVAMVAKHATDKLHNDRDFAVEWLSAADALRKMPGG